MPRPHRPGWSSPPPFRSFRRCVGVLLAFVLVLAGCTSGGGDATSTTTTMSGTSTSTLPQDPDTALRAELDELVTATEEIRGLPFVVPPTITVLDDAAFAQRVEQVVDSSLDPEALAITGDVYRLLGLLGADDDLGSLVAGLLEEQVAGFYDGEAGELVVPGGATLTPYDRIVVVHELVHALGDQHFDLYDTLVTLEEEGRFDEADAYLALVEGDATYFMLQYMLTLPPAELLGVGLSSAADELLGSGAGLDDVPAFLAADLLFPYDEGFRLVEEIVATGGIAAVDRAYESPPRSTEHVLHPGRYFASEAPLDIASPDPALTGWDVVESGRFGEHALRLLFTGSRDAGYVTQVGDGWGGDAYVILENGPDVAFVLHYRGDGERDAIEVTEALIAHARTVLSLGEGASDGAGLVWAAEDRFVSVDRNGDEVVLAVTSDPEIGPILAGRVAP